MTTDLPECSGSDEDEARQRSLASSTDSDDHRDLGHWLVSQGRQAEAAEAFRRALSLATRVVGRATISAELAWILYEPGDTSEAFQLATSALESLASEPETPESLIARGALSSVAAYATWLTDRIAAEGMPPPP
jgi:Tfp pilus assembly protein PilF